MASRLIQLPKQRRSLLGVGTAILLLFLPLPFAAVVPWAQTAFQVSVAALAVLAAVMLNNVVELRNALIPAGALLLTAVVAVVQVAPLTGAACHVLAPGQTTLEESAHLLENGTAAGPVHASLAPGATVRATLTWTSVALLLLCAAVAGRDRRGRRLITIGLVAAAAFQVVFGARNLGHDTIWGVPVPGSTSRLRGTFVNADHLALFLGIVLPVVAAWAWVAWRHAFDEPAIERRIVSVGIPVALWLFLFVGLAFTGSRAGLLAALAAAGVQGLLLARQSGRLRVSPVGILAGVTGLATVAAIGFQQGFGRWLATSQYDLSWNDRLNAYAAAIGLAPRSPWLGLGLSSFRDAFSMVSPVLATRWWHAHNDYLELLLSVGVIGVVLVGAAVVASARTLLRTQSDLLSRSEDRAAALAALGALTALAIHSCFDFGLSMPANAAAIAVVTGSALGASHRGPYRRARESTQ